MATTYTFDPPYVSYGWPTENRFTKRIKIPRGLTVISDGAGGWYTTEVPFQGDLEPYIDGLTYFLGGHHYLIDATTATSLTAGGFTVIARAGTGYGSGPYGTNLYGG